MADIFDEWKNKERHKNELFITDGAIDEEFWDNSNHKIMFLLKEAYDSNKASGSWDLSSLIRRRGVSGRTFKPMAQWAYGISNVLDGNGIVPFIDNSKSVKESLLSSSIVNIKKSGGKKKSSGDNLKKYVDEDWTLIQSQIKALSPKIVICGRTWPAIKNKIEYIKIKNSDRAYISDGVVYIDYWHPSNRAANLMNYYSVCAIVDLALKSKV